MREGLEKELRAFAREDAQWPSLDEAYNRMDEYLSGIGCRKSIIQTALKIAPFAHFLGSKPHMGFKYPPEMRS